MLNDSVTIPAATPQELESTTYRIEKWRALPSGVLETATGTFLLLIAVQALQAGPTEKAMIAAGGNIGLLLTPLVVQAVERRRWHIAHGASIIAVAGSAAFAIAALFPALAIYVLGAVIGAACLSALTPLVIQVYQDNYPAAQRGHLFSRSTVIRVAAAAVFAELAGRLLTTNLELYRWLLVIFAVAFVISALLLWRIPSRPLTVLDSRNPIRGLRYLRDDRIFRTTMIVWMLMGFANLMMTPLRIEYLANPVYGLALTPQEIALLVAIIPALVRLVLSPAWGWLFDRMNFFVLAYHDQPGIRGQHPRILYGRQLGRSHPGFDRLRHRRLRRRRGLEPLGNQVRPAPSRRRLHVRPHLLHRRARRPRPAC